MAVAASENTPDFVAFSREILGRIYARRGQMKEAIREYRLAQEEAVRLGITRLQADSLLGLAKIQIGLGDAGAARNRAIEALKLANEGLLVLRQVKALVILGQATAQLGQVGLARSYVSHAAKVSASANFRLAKHDAETVLADLH